MGKILSAFLVKSKTVYPYRSFFHSPDTAIIILFQPRSPGAEIPGEYGMNRNNSVQTEQIRHKEQPHDYS